MDTQLLLSFAQSIQNQNTRKAYMADIRHFCGFLKIRQKSVVGVSRRDVSEFSESLTAAKNSTRARKLSSLRTFYKWMIEIGIRKKLNPAEGLQEVIQQDPPLEKATAEDALAVLMHIEKSGMTAMRDRMCVMLVVQYGMNASKISRLKESDFAELTPKIDEAFVDRYIKKKRQHKRFRESEILVPSSYGKPLGTRSIRRIFHMRALNARVKKTRLTQFIGVLSENNAQN